MKRIILTALFLTAFVIAGSSQTGVFTGVLGKPTKPLKHDLRKTGLVINPELGVTSMYAAYPVVKINVGYQFSTHFYAGGGLGVLYEFYNIYAHYNTYALYAGVRCYWFDKRFSPFVEMNAGVTIARPFNFEGPYFIFMPAFGYGIKNFDFKITPTCSGKHSWEWDVLFTICYNFTIKKR